MKTIIIISMLLITTTSFCQRQTYRSIAFYNSQSAKPFSKFGGLVSGIIHPGIEISQRKIFSQRKKHAWFWDAKASIFYHRFVQLGIPVTANIGYRHKILHDLSIDASIGAGYLHSIPASQKFKLDNQGNYLNNKGIGRGQGCANLGITLNYIFNPLAPKPTEIFLGYFQMLQLPYIKSYVPLLPYNQLKIGLRKKIK